RSSRIGSRTSTRRLATVSKPSVSDSITPTGGVGASTLFAFITTLFYHTTLEFATQTQTFVLAVSCRNDGYFITPPLHALTRHRREVVLCRDTRPCGPLALRKLW